MSGTSAAGATRLVLVLLTGLLLLVVVAGSTLAGPWDLAAPDQIESEPVTYEPPPDLENLAPSGVGEGESRTLGTVFLVVVAVAVLIVLAFLVYRVVAWARRELETFSRRPRAARSDGSQVAVPTDLVSVPVLQVGVEEATARLRGALSSTDAIIAAWLALEESAEDSGAKRAPSQTPTEFTVAVLDATPASAPAVQDLLALYHLARFTRTPTTPEHVDRAERALVQLAADFAARPLRSDEVARDHSDEVARDHSDEVARDHSGGVARDHSDEVARDHSGEVARDHSGEVAP